MRAVRRFVGGRTPFRQTAGIKTACRDLAGCFFWAKPIQAGNADAFPAFFIVECFFALVPEKGQKTGIIIGKFPWDMV